jgi:hypothetical protein
MGEKRKRERENIADKIINYEFMQLIYCGDFCARIFQCIIIDGIYFLAFKKVTISRGEVRGRKK